MRRETWISLIACLIGASMPLLWVGWDKGFIWVFALVDSLPFLLVFSTVWMSRSDRRASRRAMILAFLILGISIAGWWHIYRDNNPYGFLILGFFVIPILQLLVLLVWLTLVALLSGRRVRRENRSVGTPEA